MVFTVSVAFLITKDDAAAAAAVGNVGTAPVLRIAVTAVPITAGRVVALAISVTCLPNDEPVLDQPTPLEIRVIASPGCTTRELKPSMS
jgi:hypothetical protein